jgi:S-adenosylmethionine:tRNA ribosyltransferase-isomerase
VELRELDFPLPEELIARHPPAERREARMLVVQAGESHHHVFAELPQFLRDGDLLVLNDTRVVPARLRLQKETGGRVEGLYLHNLGDGQARCLLSGGRLRPGVVLYQEGCTSGPRLCLVEKHERGEWTVALDGAEDWSNALAQIGSTPLPPYIRRLREDLAEETDSAEDRSRYQTVWAQAEGSVAAPTASLHFDHALLQVLEQQGVELAYLTLHVGRGTFLPVEAERVEEHPMHAEAFTVSDALADKLRQAKQEGRRVIAAGTTVCRALEAWAQGDQGETRLMILPGHDFQMVDALLTNFHTPKSTLLALVAGLAQHQGAADGLALVKQVYAEAVAQRYRFFSYGDASLWLPKP